MFKRWIFLSLVILQIFSCAPPEKSCFLSSSCENKQLCIDGKCVEKPERLRQQGEGCNDSSHCAGGLDCIKGVYIEGFCAAKCPNTRPCGSNLICKKLEGKLYCLKKTKPLFPVSCSYDEISRVTACFVSCEKKHTTKEALEACKDGCGHIIGGTCGESFEKLAKCGKTNKCSTFSDKNCCSADYLLANGDNPCHMGEFRRFASCRNSCKDDQGCIDACFNFYSPSCKLALMAINDCSKGNAGDLKKCEGQLRHAFGPFAGFFNQ